MLGHRSCDQGLRINSAWCLTGVKSRSLFQLGTWKDEEVWRPQGEERKAEARLPKKYPRSRRMERIGNSSISADVKESDTEARLTLGQT